MSLQFFYSLVSGGVIGGVAGFLGSLMIIKRMALVGDALGHVALPGIALALIYGFNVSWGALLALILGIFLIWFFETKTRLPMETLTGIIFAASLAVAFLLLPEEEISAALIGDISQIARIDAFLSILAVVFVFFVLQKISPGMTLMMISEDLARVQKVDIKKHNFIFLLCVAIIVALGIKVVGSLLMGALVIIPASTARNLSRNMLGYKYGSMLIGASSCVLGILLFESLKVPAGPLIVLINSLFFIVSVYLKREKF